MSRYTPENENPNPAVRFFQWAGDKEKGYVEYYDKSLPEGEQNVEVPLPFKFLVLDKVTQVTGGVDRDGKWVGFWSNAVKDIRTQPLTVRSKQGIEAQGLYSEDIKGRPGMSYMTGLYIAFQAEGKEEFQLGYLKLKGAGLTAWIEITKTQRDIYAGGFAIKDKEAKKKGSNKYFAPVFMHSMNLSPDIDDYLKPLDDQLQAYFKEYFKAQPNKELEYSGNEETEEAEAIREEVEMPEVEDGDLLF